MDHYQRIYTSRAADYHRLIGPEDQAEFFFGPELARSIRSHRWADLPEWTGAWGRVG